MTGVFRFARGQIAAPDRLKTVFICHIQPKINRSKTAHQHSSTSHGTTISSHAN